jgi:hypothetical protein
MSQISFGYYLEGKGYKSVDERVMRASAGIILFVAVIASINGFILKNYAVIPYLTGFMMINFLIGLLVNPKFSPTVFLGYLFTRKQSRLPIGAVQKKFAWSLGFSISAVIFVLSFFLLKDPTYFDPVCGLCMICIFLLFLETAFGICVGCKLYNLSIKLKLLPKPKERPNCMGNSCEI